MTKTELERSIKTIIRFNDDHVRLNYATDVHINIRNLIEASKEYLKLRELISKEFDIDISMWKI